MKKLTKILLVIAGIILIYAITVLTLAWQDGYFLQNSTQIYNSCNPINLPINFSNFSK